MANPSHDNRMHSSSALREKNMISREFNLYLHAGHSIPLVINCNQYDRGEQWLFTLFNADGTQYMPSSGAIVGIKSDNLGIINSGTVDSQGRVVINETQQMTAAVGKAVFELLIDDQTHGTANFIVLVEPKPGDNADLSESDYSLFQQAIDGTSATAIAEGVADWMDENLTPTTPVVDASLTVQGAAADAKKTGDEISALKSQIAQGGLRDSFKQALLQLASKVAYIDEDGQDYYDALYSALYDVELISISASLAQGTVILDIDTLNDLKQYLTVTAHFDNGTSTEVTTYELSGTLTAGTSIITVTYEDATTTLNVNVTATTDVTPSIANWNKANYVTMTTDAVNNTIYFKTTSNKTYQGANNPFTTESGYSYRMVTDLAYVKGQCRIAVQNSSASIIKASPAAPGATASGKLVLDFDHDAAIASLRIFCTFATAMAGECTYSNLKVYKYATAV